MEVISEEHESLTEIPLQDPEEPPIKLIVTTPVFIKETIGKYVSYKITGKNNSEEIETNRRYNEFKNLRLNFLSVWGGIYIPPLPKAKFFVKNR